MCISRSSTTERHAVILRPCRTILFWTRGWIWSTVDVSMPSEEQINEVLTEQNDMKFDSIPFWNQGRARVHGTIVQTWTSVMSGDR